MTLKDYGPHAWFGFIGTLLLNAIGWLSPLFDIVLSSPRLFLAAASTMPTIVSMTDRLPEWAGTVSLIAVVALLVAGLVYRHFKKS